MKRLPRINRTGLVMGSSIMALASVGQAYAQQAVPESDQLEELVVTGSRIATRSGVDSPTPLTVVSTEELLQTTPTNIPDGLNKLPVFAGSTTPTRPGSGSSAIAQNVLNLRGFGAQRTLILLDGKRVTPTNSDGTVDVDTLPQMLMSRVDVVTGGASAVYGSDAVTGVVNFVLDKDFTGFKADVNTGISTEGDAASYKVETAAGWDLFGDRGHFLISAGARLTDPVRNFDRPAGPDSYYLTGNGSAATPYVTTINARSSNNAAGGLIVGCRPACPNALGQQFVSDGVLGPFDVGTPSTTANVASGGDGSYNPYATAFVETENEQFFTRFGFDLTDSTSFYVQGTYANAEAKGWHFPVKVGSPGNVFFKNNPFLSPAVQAALGNNNAANVATNSFTLNSYITTNGPEGLIGSELENEYTSVSTGLEGTWNGFRWDVSFTHGDNEATVRTINNTNTQKLFASLDAVQLSDGSIVCYASTQAATADAYRDCVPLNPFGPTAITPEAFAYSNVGTSYQIANKMDSVATSFTGTAFEGWAGPIDFALSAEARWNDYEVDGSANSTTFADCTGLRICSPNTLLYSQATVSDVTADNNVWEVAGELSIPLLKGVPFVDSLDANLAARHTDYSTSGGVETWKGGLTYQIIPSIRIRATESKDIRAPTLADLFQPVTSTTSVNYTDIHTGVTGPVRVDSQGNQDLVPEEARTTTIGIVFTPTFLPEFSASIDYYKIEMDNAIGAVQANNLNSQRLCEASGGASPYCSLYVRPLPFSDTSAANFPTMLRNQSLNLAWAELEGYDLELTYRLDMFGGTFTTRVLGNYQPLNRSQTSAITPVLDFVGPDTRVTAFISYDRNDWTVSVQDRWLSSFSRKEFADQHWINPNIASYNTVDLNVERRLTIGNADAAIYFTAQNVFDREPPIYAQAGGIGVVYPNYPGQSIMGTYLTLGFKTDF